MSFEVQSLDQINLDLSMKLYTANFHLKMNEDWIKALLEENQNLKHQLRMSELRCNRLECELRNQMSSFDQLMSHTTSLQSEVGSLRQSSANVSFDHFNSTFGSFAGSSTSLFQPQQVKEIAPQRAMSMEVLSKPSAEKKRNIIEKANEIEKKLLDENANKTNENCRYFIGHLSPIHTEKVLMKYFSKFGHVLDLFIPVDTEKNSRGFAYVTFGSLNTKNPLKIADHVVEGKKIYIDMNNYSQNSTKVTKTVLASGLIQEISHNSLSKYFSQFGKVVDIVRHRESRRKFSRWAFIHFDSEANAEKVVKKKEHKVEGILVDIRFANKFYTEKDPSTKPKNNLNVHKYLISNLNPKTNSKSLRRHFEKFGNVHDCYIPTFYGKQESKCFGYIVIDDDAKFESYNQVIDGVNVLIESDGPRMYKDKTTNLLVSASPEILEKISEDDLRATFKKFGNIVSIRKPSDPKTKKSAHYAFVEFDSSNAVDKAIQKFAYMIKDSLVCVTKSRHDQKK